MLNSFKRTACALAMAGASALAMLPAGAVAQDKWVAYSYLPSANMNGVKGLEAIARDFSQATGGKITVAVNVGGSLPIAGTAITQAVGDGIIQMGDDGFFSGNVEVGGVVGLPLMFSSWAEYEKGLTALMPALTTAFDKQGVVILGLYSWPAQVLWTTKKMTTLADLKGLKIRPSSPEQAEFVRKFGGNAVSMNSSEVGAALATGVADGVFTASVSGGRVWKDQLKYNYRLPLNYFPSFITINKELFERLPKAQQEALRDIVRKHGEATTALNLADEARITQELAAGGITVTEATAADLQEAMRQMSPYWDTWARGKSSATRAALKEVRATVGR